MISLDDCGKELNLKFLLRYALSQHKDVRVQMVIKAPKGTLALFDYGYISPDTQCEVIRAFMEEHKND